MKNIIWNRFLYKCSSLSVYGLYYDLKISRNYSVRIRFW